jgi:hypothetical protein
MAALTADLAEVHTIMSKNIAEVLGQGEKLDSKCPGTQEGFACCLLLYSRTLESGYSW